MLEKISRPRELKAELEKTFTNAIIRIGTDFVSITQDMFYGRDRHELIRLEKKYKTGLWCDVQSGKVHYHFHMFGSR